MANTREKLRDILMETPYLEIMYNIDEAVDYLIDNGVTVSKHTKEQPTADVVEVVRCKDCKKFIEYSDDYKFKVEGADGDCHIRLMYSTDNQFCDVKYDDFCSYGERK